MKTRLSLISPPASEVVGGQAWGAGRRTSPSNSRNSPSAWLLTRFPSGVFRLAEHPDAVDDPQADRKDAQRPPRGRSAAVRAPLDRPKRGREDGDHPPVQVAGEQRERSSELDRAQDDGDPPPRVKTAEDVTFFGDVEARIRDSGDAVEEVQRAHDQEQNPDEHRSSHASYRTYSRSAPRIASHGAPWIASYTAHSISFWSAHLKLLSGCMSHDIDRDGRPNSRTAKTPIDANLSDFRFCMHPPHGPSCAS